MAMSTRAAVIAAGVSLVLAGCSSTASPDAIPATDGTRAVVMVSGVGAVSPYTTPDQGCSSGLSAGNTDTFLREYMSAAGLRVYTAPAMAGPGQVVDQDTPEGGPFGDCPAALPAELTVNALDSVDTGGQHLAAFIGYLHDELGVDSVDIVAHSLGGIFARNAIRELSASGSAVKVESLTTIGSPWEPVMLANPTDSSKPLSACDGQLECTDVLAGLLAIPSTSVLIDFFQPAPFNAWTEQQVGLLDQIPVTLIGGTIFSKPGGLADKWPNDGLVQYSAAMATSITDSVIPHRTCYTFPDTHSLYLSEMAGVPDDEALTWNPAVGDVIINGINTARGAMSAPNRLGCPVP